MRLEEADGGQTGRSSSPTGEHMALITVILSSVALFVAGFVTSSIWHRRFAARLETVRAVNGRAVHGLRRGAESGADEG
jgi:hypothetical protein